MARRTRGLKAPGVSCKALVLLGRRMYGAAGRMSELRSLWLGGLSVLFVVVG